MKMKKQARKARESLQTAAARVDNEDALPRGSDLEDASTVASTSSARTSAATSLLTSSAASSRGVSDAHLHGQEARGSLPAVAEETPAPELSAAASMSLALGAVALGALAKGQGQKSAVLAVPALALALQKKSTDSAALLAIASGALEPLRARVLSGEVQSAAVPLAILSLRVWAQQRSPLKAAALGLPALAVAASRAQWDAVGALVADAGNGKLDGLAAMFAALAARVLIGGGDSRTAGMLLLPAAAVVAIPRQLEVQTVPFDGPSILARLRGCFRAALRSANTGQARAAVVALGALACRSLLWHRNPSKAAAFGFPAAMLTTLAQLEVHRLEVDRKSLF